MADENTQATGATPEAGGAAGSGTTEPAGKGERTFTQAEVNDLVEKRLKKERSKYADYAELKAAAGAHADYDEVLAERDALKAKAERAELVGRVAREAGVPAALVSLLSGADEAQLAEQAGELAKALKARAYPNVEDTGGTKPVVTAEDIRKIKDPRERIRQRAAHPELFEK